EVIDSAMLADRPNTSPIQLMGDLPGVDLTGVGPNQVRPVIRGERGQRILLLEDGLRLNNSRRQQDFGELASLVDPNTLARIEVVRGPSSVLYGSDAIGGVVNLIGAGLPWGDSGRTLHGSLRYTYGGNGNETRPAASLSGRAGQVTFRFDAAHRTADPYTAPAGTFGDVKLTSDQLVQGSGITDRNITAALGLEVSPRHRFYAKGWSYAADDAGFGMVDPAALGENTTVEILYPRQRVTRGTLGYVGRTLGTRFFDRVDASVYAQGNERDLAQNIRVPFGPSAYGDFHTRNFTDVGTIGGRLEAAKLLGSSTLLTYGVDLFRDRTTNTDNDTTRIVGFGPTQTEVDSAPNLPNASYRALGLFVQSAFQVTGRLNVVVGARYQDNKAETRITPDLPDAPVSSTDRAVAGAVNALYSLSDQVTLVGSVGRGFRSPNLVERFFNGVTPEGSGYQSRNPDLSPETSINTDLGVRVGRGRLAFELFGFRNAISDGIRIIATGDTVSGFPEYQNVNIDKLHSWGVEGSGRLLVAEVFTLGASYTWLHEENTDEPQTPVGQSYTNKVTASVRYDHPAGHLWSAVRMRHQGATDQVALGTSAVGDRYPGFTTFGLDAGLKLFDTDRIRHSLSVSVENLGNTLYAEAGNAGFFRPAAGRRVAVGVTSEF
ncbi:MAG TPA: TonB-dependent receptor, partial [Gemmatimonadales bacterium]|nr:TonB-dependent receptor [Gemmatimonadales bacterium]